MQTLKINKPLLFIINPGLLLIGVLAFFYMSQIILSIFYIFWITTACALWLIATPAGNQRLIHHDYRTKRLTWQSWFSAIALLEITLLCSYLGIAALCGDFFAVNTTVHPALFEGTVKTLLLHNGLFPWSFYAVIAVGMGFTAYHDQTDAYLSNLLKPFIHLNPQSTLGLIANIGMRRCVLFAISIFFIFTALLLCSLLLPLHIHIAHGFTSTTILTTISILAISYSDTAKNYLLRLFSRRVPTYFSLPLFCIILATLFLLISTMCKGIYAPTSNTEPPEIAQQWIQFHWQTAWTMFSILWFLCLTPLVCTVIARLSHGYRAREIVIGVLALPIALTLFFMIENTLPFAMNISLLNTKLLAIIGLFILLPLLINHPRLSDAMFAYFPKNGLHRHRDHHTFVMELTRITAISLYLYLTVGVNGLAVFLFAPNFLLMFTLPLTALAIIKRLSR